MMNAHTKITRLTEEEYLLRSAALNRDLEAAEATCNAVAFQFAQGEIAEEEATAVAATAETIRMKLRGLTAIRAGTERLEELEAAEAEVEAKREAAKRVRHSESQAEKAFNAILKHAAGFEPLMDAYSKALFQIAEELRQNRDLYHPEELGGAIRILNDRDRERLLLEGKLFDSGLGSLGIGHQQVANQAREWEASGGLVFKRTVILSLIQRLLGEED